MRSLDVDELLHAWALWSLRGMRGLGYPCETVLYRLMRYGVGVGVRAVVPEEVSGVEVLVDEVVSRLRRECPDVGRVVVQHYLGCGSGRRKARELGIAWSTYRKRLEAGLKFVAREIDRVPGFG